MKRDQQPTELERLADIARRLRQAAIASGLALLPAARLANHAIKQASLSCGKMQGALRRVVRTASEFDAAMTRVDEVGMRGCEAGSAFRRVPAGRQALAEKLLQVAAASGHESYIPDEYRKYLPKLTNAECYELERTTPFSFSAIRAEFPRLRERRNQRHGGPIAR